MKDLVMIAIIIVIKLTYRQNSMEEKKCKQTNKLDLVKKLVRLTCIEIFFIINGTNTKRKC